MSRCGFKNGHQKEVGLCAQITLSNSRFDSQHHNLWDTYVIIKKKIILHFNEE